MKRLSWLFLFLCLGCANWAQAETSRAPRAPEVPPPSPAQQMADVFDRLARSKDADETLGLLAKLERLRQASGSDTSDLLLQRAHAAMDKQSYPLAVSLLDAVIAMRPQWAEGWNARATVRYLTGDPEGSMADIAETLKREPRHIGALAGMAAIYEDAGHNEEALRVYERALEIAPGFAPLRTASDRIKAKIAGQSL